MQKGIARLWTLLEEDGKLVAGRVKLGSDIGVAPVHSTDDPTRPLPY